MNREPVGMANDYCGSDECMAHIERRLENIVRAGFTHIHWCNDWSGPYLYSCHEMQQIGRLLAKYDLKVKGVHASEGVKRFPASSENKRWGCGRFLDDRKYYLSDNEYNRKAGVELIKNRVDLAEYIGAEEIVLHYIPPYLRFQESPAYVNTFWCNSRKSFDELEQYCVAKKIKIALENLPEIPVAEQEKYFDKLLGIYGADLLGMCYDAGHAMIRNSGHHCSFLEKYADRIISVHLHDNLGFSRDDYDEINMANADMHRIPFEGVIDWATAMEYLATTSYRLPLILEVNMPAGVSDDEFLKKAYDAAVRLTLLFKQAKPYDEISAAGDQ